MYDRIMPPMENVAASTDTVRFMLKVYGWMFFALFLTTMTIVVFGIVPPLTMLMVAIVTSRVGIIVLILGQLGLVWFLSTRAQSMPLPLTIACFIVYALSQGFFFSIFGLIYTWSSIIAVFGVTGLLFGVMAVIGAVTRTDLTSLGGFCFMGLIGIIIAGVVNFFFLSSLVSFVISICGIIIFLGLTAYDTQKLKAMAVAGGGGLAILGALTLYLDFINLFLMLLRLFGRRR